MKRNKRGKEFAKTKNIIKLEKRIQLLKTRNNYVYKTTMSIAKTKLYGVIIKDSNASVNLSKYKSA